MIGTSECSESKSLRLSAVDDLPDVEGHVPLDLTVVRWQGNDPSFPGRSVCLRVNGVLLIIPIIARDYAISGS